MKLDETLIYFKDLLCNFLWVIVLVFACLLLFGKDINLQNYFSFLKDERPEYTYKIHNSNLDPNFSKKTSKIIKASRWNKSHNLREIPIESEEIPKINVYLVPRKLLNKYHDGTEFYPDGRPIRFSITLTKSHPEVFIDSNNWLYGVKDSGLTLEQYKEYVILHEFGHALGYDHQPCNEQTAVNGVCPVLYQSTRGCPDGYKCGYKITDYDYKTRI
jgi:hypothetical protein